MKASKKIEDFVLSEIRTADNSPIDGRIIRSSLLEQILYAINDSHNTIRVKNGWRKSKI